MHAAMVAAERPTEPTTHPSRQARPARRHALPKPALLLALLLAVSAGILVAVRAELGVPFGSDAYSYLVAARQAVGDGTLAHSPYDYTTPKPLELAVAALGTALRTPTAIFGWWAVASYLAAVAAAAALAHRLAGRAAALASAVLAVALPGLVREGLSADAMVPYAACVVGAATLRPGRRAASGLLALGGLLRPEAWGLAAIAAALGWRRSSAHERTAAVAAALLPPAVWLGADWAVTGDPLYATRVIARYEAVSTRAVSLRTALAWLGAHWIGWGTCALALGALAVGLRRRPLDPAVVYPAALAAALAVELGIGLATPATLGRYALAVALFATTGAAVTLGRAERRLGRPALAAGLSLALVLAAAPLATAVRTAQMRGRVAASLASGIAEAAKANLRPGAVVATDRSWQGALAYYGRVDRLSVVPIEAVGPPLAPDRVAAVLLLRGGDAARTAWEEPELGLSGAWELLGAGSAVTQP